MLSIVPLPEPFATAFARNDARAVCDVEGDTPEALFGRGLARGALGRDREARADFLAASEKLGEACQLELAWLDQKENRELDAAAATASQIIEQAPAGSALRARGLHVAGLVAMKRAQPIVALDLLRSAVEAYGSLGELSARAQVLDSLGMLQTDAGQVEDAVHYFALSLVDKTLLDDRLGVAMTLGNLGRLHLGAGRLADAIACFERDLAISESLGDERGRARMLEDLGRVHLELADFPQAEKLLRQALEVAGERDYRDLQFFAHKDLALTLCRAKQHDEADKHLGAAEELLPELAGDYFRIVWSAARGELLAARGDKTAVDVLSEAVAGFEVQQLPEMEIAARIVLAQAHVTHAQEPAAKSCLLRALAMTHRKGLRRFVPVINEALGSLGLVEGAEVDSGRQLAAGGASVGDHYVLVERLGGGTFGEVFRVYDPRRGHEVALKRLLLERLYDPAIRRSILASARVELEVASRVRHPGVARVLAIGTEPEGSTFVVQDLVSGTSLRKLMEQRTRPQAKEVLACLSQVAFALAALHEAGVCHRDLKPDNVIVRGDGAPVLIDFGVAHFMKSGETVGFAGTLDYAAPEQIAASDVDGRADLYALGVMAFEWLCGLRPLAPQGGGLAEMARDLFSRSAPSVKEFRPDVDDAVDALIGKLLAKKPSRRPATAHEVGHLMAELAAR